MLIKWGQSPGPLGFKIYRLSYGQSDEQWAAFVRKLEADLADWGDGVAGAEDIRELLKVHWLDGKELGIAEGDIEAAKEYVPYFLPNLALFGPRNCLLVPS